MTKDAKKRFYQIRLSTAIIMLLFAGILLYFNVKRAEYVSGYEVKGANRVFYCGWPIPIVCYEVGHSDATILRLQVIPVGVSINFLTALTLELIVAYICERNFRRIDKNH
jgi:hypothetical protein